MGHRVTHTHAAGHANSVLCAQEILDQIFGVFKSDGASYNLVLERIAKPVACQRQAPGAREASRLRTEGAGLQACSNWARFQPQLYAQLTPWHLGRCPKRGEKVFTYPKTCRWLNLTISMLPQRLIPL